MCLAIPAKIVNIEESMGTVDMAGIQKKVSLILLEDAQVGDYVIVHAGFGIHKIDEAAAMESLRVLREMAHLLDVEDPAGPDEVTITGFGTEEVDS
ncbi:MAG: HypC/HybG/HupF family hydrogenase formation chaperone [Deltaproteobacteria bacterium]|nr:HypC/HybG/HupF family hydrogenase formation chaperone [Deltaproteobacteria bacterium]